MWCTVSRWSRVGSSGAVSVVELICIWCGENGTRIRRSARYCSMSCKWQAKEMRRRARSHRVNGEFSRAELIRLWGEFGRRCAYCSTATSRTEIQPDHVYSISRGGRNDYGNLLPACGECNADKRDLSLEEWAADRERRGLPPRRTTRFRGAKYGHLILPLEGTRTDQSDDA